MKSICVSTYRSVNLGLLIMRIGLGIVFMIHGYGKFVGGHALWEQLGSIVHTVGIPPFLPAAFWGLMAAAVEFIGGILLITGFATRLASLSIAIVMIFAILIHTNKGDSFQIYSHPLSLLIVLGAFIISGAGSYSLDSLFGKKHR